MGIKKLITREEEDILLFKEMKPHRLLNLLAGANGVGKSTLLKRIKEEKIDIEKDGEYEIISYINSENNKRHELIRDENYLEDMLDKWNANNLSEGQSIIYSTMDFFESLKNKKEGNYVVLIDEIDSGLSVDNINLLCHLITEILEKRQDMQFFISINNYHWVYVFKHVISMYDGHLRNLITYEEYWELIRDQMNSLYKKRKGNMFKGVL